jgi:signal peptidase I
MNNTFSFDNLLNSLKNLWQSFVDTLTDPQKLKQFLLALWHENKGFLLAVLAIVIVRSVIIDQYHVPSGSMEPAIQIGDRVLVNKLAYQLRVPFSYSTLALLNEPKRGDVVVFDHPDFKFLTIKESFSKRTMILMGDTVRIGLNETDLFDVSTRENFNKVYAEIVFVNGVGTIFKRDDSVEFTVNDKAETQATIANDLTVKIDGREFSFNIQIEDGGFFAERKTMVKRLIGLPGDRITVNSGKVFVNGEPTTLGVLANPAKPDNVYMREKVGDLSVLIQRFPKKAEESEYSDFGRIIRFMEFTVPKDYYFFMGDNRDDSMDGRYWGFVPRSMIKGKALNVTFSLDGFTPRWSRFGQSLYKDLTAQSVP